MKIAEREEALIYFLLKKQTYITATKVAEELKISSKTIYRLIKKINEKSMHGELITTEKGKGIKLNYDVYLKSKIYLGEGIIGTCSPVERRKNIVQTLLLESPNWIDRDELFKNYYLSQSVIRADEDIIKEYLDSRKLELNKKGNKLSIIGSEIDIRRVLTESLLNMNILNFNDLKSIKVDFNQENFEFVLEQIEMMEDRLSTIIPYPYSINLLTHLYILMNRVGRGIFDLNESIELIESSAVKVEEEKYYKLAKTVKKNIENYLNTPIPESEASNILVYLLSSRIDKPSETDIVFPQDVIELTNFYISEFEKKSKTNIVGTSFFYELASHMKPMINRLKNNILVKNSLIDDIKLEYGSIFEIIKSISDEVYKKYNKLILEDEIGFITVYFARYIEQNPKKIRTLLLCTTGMGTSELLKVKVTKLFPEIEVISIAAIKQCSEEFLKKNSVDLILTTVKLEENFDIPLVLVNTMFIKKDQENVKKEIRKILWK